MAHLHAVSVHPFRDGNGRISRILQPLVLAREGLPSPEFASIEEYLGAHTSEYYAVLQRVQGGRYQPERMQPTGSLSASRLTSFKRASVSNRSRKPARAGRFSRASSPIAVGPIGS